MTAQRGPLRERLIYSARIRWHMEAPVTRYARTIPEYSSTDQQGLDQSLQRGALPGIGLQYLGA